MNVILWVVQVLLAVHTAMGAIWKFSKSPAETMPSLAAVPQSLWVALSLVEIVLAICFVAPALNKEFGISAVIAGVVITVEMLAFCGIHFQSGAKDFGPIGYWLVVAALCSFVAYGRLMLSPF
jgi:hypothetical protein